MGEPTTTTTILAGVVIALLSGIVGRSIGERDTIKQSTCNERREACQQLIFEKIDNLSKEIRALTELVRTKL